MAPRRDRLGFHYSLRPGKFTEQLACRRRVGRVGGFRRRKRTEPNLSSFLGNKSPPPSRLAAPENTLVPGRVSPRTPPVRAVLCRCRTTEIAPTVVRGIAIAVINHRAAPSAGHVEPRQLMCLVRMVVDVYLHVSRHITGAQLVAETLQPAKFAGLFVVVQQLAQPRARQSRTVFHGRLAI
jgi:hypothetical protein